MNTSKMSNFYALAEAQTAFDGYRKMIGEQREMIADKFTTLTTWIQLQTADMVDFVQGSAGRIGDQVGRALGIGETAGENWGTWLEGSVTVGQTWQKLITIAFAEKTMIYGLSVMIEPVLVVPTTSPANELQASICFGEAAQAAPGGSSITSMLGPRWDITGYGYQGHWEKPHNPACHPISLWEDINVVYPNVTVQNQNLYLPIDRYRIGPKGLSVWGFWNKSAGALAPGIFRVAVSTAPGIV